MKLDFDDLPPLEDYCDCFCGERYPSGPEPVPCTECVGGRRPTEFGRAVLELVETYLAVEGRKRKGEQP